MSNASLRKYSNAQNGYFFTATKDNWGGNSFSVSEVEKAEQWVVDNQLTDCYCSIATFQTPKRSSNNVAQMLEHFIDVDGHGLHTLTKKEAQEIIRDVLTPLFDVAIPKPTRIAYSGRGLHIFYELTDGTDLVKWAHTNRCLTGIYDNIFSKENALINVDTSIATDKARYSRVTGTYNTKARKKAETLYYSGLRYEQTDFECYDIDIVVPSNKKKQKTETIHLSDLKGMNSKDVLEHNRASAYKNIYKCKHGREYTLKTLTTARLQDLNVLIYRRNMTGLFEGYRNNLIMIASQLIREKETDTREVYKQLQEVNNAFAEPLDDYSVNAWYKSTLHNPCYYSNKKIIEVLGITESEQMAMKTLLSSKVKHKRYYYSHREERKADRVERYSKTKERNLRAKEVVIAKAKELHAQGLKQREIADIMGISKPTLIKYLRAE